MNSLEILAPAGSAESVKAAVRCGANAVYLGLKQFSARAAAQNFTCDELLEICAYCHQRNVLVYLTANVLIFDSELDTALDLIKQAAKAGIDAVIVQDIGFASLIKKAVPDLPLHGSTQMSVHTKSGAKALYEMGFKRVVLAREMTRKEIKEVVESCPIETEVFVHGALCMCVSGQCYMSAMLGSRSANRGQCAQPCRLPFKVKNGNGYALSLKDNSLVPYLRELEAMGVKSAKIEGRMKRPEYVAAAVTACRESLDYGLVSENTRRLLNDVFSRTGFTDGYYTDRRGQDMFGYRQKSDVVSADSKTFKEIRALYNSERQSVSVSFNFTLKDGEKPKLTLCDGTNTVSAYSDVLPQKAINVELTEEKCAAQLKKTGSTPYNAALVYCDIQSGLSLPISVLNNLRRECTQKLDALRAVPKTYTFTDFDVKNFLSENKRRGIPSQKDKSAKRICLNKCEFFPYLRDFSLVFVPLFSPLEKIKELINQGVNVGCEIPRGMFSLDEKIEKRLREIKKLGIENVLALNIGAVYLAKKANLDVCGGFSLNLVNTASLVWAQNYGLKDVELSFELTVNQINTLGAQIKRGIITYGHLPLMLVRNCPQKNGGISCESCKNAGKLTDRLQKEFYLQCENGCTQILNGDVLSVESRLNNFVNIDYRVFRKTVENSVENVESTPDFLSKHLKSKFSTCGLYYRGVK